MRITVFGATGSVGSRVVAEALSRGHEVTAVVRNASRLSLLPGKVRGRIGDAANVDEVAALSAGQDLVISATRPTVRNERDLVSTAKALLAGVARSNVRLLLVGGAARLKVPDTGRQVIDDPRYVPPVVRDIAAACHMQFEICTADVEADWTYISPPALLVPGERTGYYRAGYDELLFDSIGKSTISIEDFAVALLDEAEAPKHRRSSFTVAAHALAVSGSDIMVETPEGTADCYFVHRANGAHPGVILWPDALGLRQAYRTTAQRLAGSGHAVLAVNPYYRITTAPIGVDSDEFNEPAGREKVMRLSNTITPEMTLRDAVTLAGYLDQQQSVDPKRKLGSLGYCMGGAMALRTAAAVADRIGAFASFHGAKLVTQQASSPHLLVPNTRASALIAIAENDDQKEPDAKIVLREAYNRARLPAEIEVYAGAMHGWCALDTKTYNHAQAERAWSRLLVMFREALRVPCP